MENTKAFYLTVIQRVFSNWTALRMAVDHGMGSKTRAIDFCPYMTEVMYMNENLSVDDVAAELEDYMDTEFQTELQDNSATQVAEQLVKFYRYCVEGNEAVAIMEMQKLPPVQLWLLTSNEINMQCDTAGSVSELTGCDSSEEDGEAKEAADDGWLTVRTRNRRSNRDF